MADPAARTEKMANSSASRPDERMASSINACTARDTNQTSKRTLPSPGSILSTTVFASGDCSDTVWRLGRYGSATRGAGPTRVVTERAHPPPDELHAEDCQDAEEQDSTDPRGGGLGGRGESEYGIGRG